MRSAIETPNAQELEQLAVAAEALEGIYIYIYTEGEGGVRAVRTRVGSTGGGRAERAEDGGCGGGGVVAPGGAGYPRVEGTLLRSSGGSARHSVEREVSRR